MHIYVDLDGVPANWQSEMVRICGKPEYADWHKPGVWPIGKSITEVLGITDDELWAQSPPDIYRNLPFTPDAEAILSVVKEFDPYFCILTSPGRIDNAYTDKARWCKDRLGINEDRFVPCKHKWRLALPGTVLIDDFTKQVNAFRARPGAHAILLPRPWNQPNGYSHAGVVGYLRAELKKNMALIHDSVNAYRTDEEFELWE